MNKTITRNIAMDIDSVGQYLNLANRTINRAIGAIQAEMITASPQEHQELLALQDQCKAELRLIDHAHDGTQGIDTEFLKTEQESAACIS